MDILKNKRCLFFIGDYMPTDEEQDAAKEIAAEGFRIDFRNANFVAAEGALEAFDMVAGLVPDRYAEAYALLIETEDERTLRMQALATAEASAPEGATAPVIAPPAPNTPAAPDWLTRPAEPVRKPPAKPPEWKPN